MMNVLGSTYLPVMAALAPKIAAVGEVVAYDMDRSLADQIGGINVMIAGHQRITADDIAVASKLRLIQQHGRGLDAIDRQAAAVADVIVANVPGGNSVAVAEHALALVLALAKRIHLTERSVQARIVGAPAGMELLGKHMLIVGLGAAGVELARRAAALGMTVSATKGNPDARPDVDLVDLGGPDDLHRLLPAADVVVLLAALTPATRNLIGAEEIGRMRPTAYLVNVARGALVDEEALHHALATERIAGAAFDTFWREPADPDEPLLQVENFVLTPHVAGFSDVSIDYVTDVMADNIHRLAEGRDLLNVVEPD